MTGRTLDDMIREYRIEPYKAADGSIGLQAWDWRGKPGSEEEIRANKDALVSLLRRREKEREETDARLERERVLALQAGHPAHVPGLRTGDLVVWFDQRMPFSYGIRRADAIFSGEAFHWDPGFTIIASLDDGEALAGELGVERWQLDAFRTGDPLGLGHDDYELRMHKVIRDWIETHKERRLPVNHPTATYYRIGRGEAIALADKVRETVEAGVGSVLDDGIRLRIGIIERYDRQRSKPVTDADARELRKRDNDLYNEGGSGYVCDYVSRERARRVAAWLRDHGVDMSMPWRPKPPERSGRG